MARGKGKPREVLVPQRSFLYGERPVIPVAYSESEARKAARSRNQRLGEFLEPKTKENPNGLDRERFAGFLGSVRGVFVPGRKGRGEITTVVNSPERSIRSIRERVLKNTDENYRKANAAATAVRIGYRQYYRDAQKKKRALYDALEPDNSYDIESILNSPLARRELVVFAMDLDSFVHQKWLQVRWHAYEEQKDRAKAYVDSLPDVSMLSFLREAIWNARSRMKYWQEIGYGVYRPDLDPNAQPPLDAYDFDPENVGNMSPSQARNLYGHLSSSRPNGEVSR